MRHVILPCNGCTVCCQGDAIYLYPELGDDASQYQTIEYKGRLILDHKPNGDCVYLDRQTGCTIWGNQPTICAELNCTDLLILPKKDQVRMIQQGLLNKSLIQAAKRMKKKLRLK